MSAFVTFLKAVLVILLALIILFGIYALILVISGSFINLKTDYMHDSKYFRLLLNSGIFLAVYGARLNVFPEGLEKVPTDGRFLIVSNHRSKFDPIVTWYVLRKSNLAFISKEENFHIPFYGKIIRRCCCLPIDRQDPREALKTLMTSAELIKNDSVSIGVYPEGTRSKSGELLPFHNGVFKIAQMAKVPIVVVTVDGAENIHRNYPLHSTDVSFKVAETIPAEEVIAMRTKDIGARVYKDFIHNLEGGTNEDEQKICIV